MARQKRADEDSSGTWLNTYADMVTLLLTFFAVLLSLSSISEEKQAALKESLQSTDSNGVSVIQGQIEDYGGEGSLGEQIQVGTLQAVGDITDLYQQLEAYVSANNMEEAVTLSMQDYVLYIRFNSNILFKADSYDLKMESITPLAFIGDGLKLYEDQIKAINICGHTAMVNNDSYGVSSWILSGERAGEVAKYLDTQKGFNPQKLVAIGYGGQYPLGDNATPEGRATNRRVELIVVGNGSTMSFDAYDALASVYGGGASAEGGSSGDAIQPTGGGSDSTGNSVEKDVSPYDN